MFFLGIFVDTCIVVMGFFHNMSDASDLPLRIIIVETYVRILAVRRNPHPGWGVDPL